MSLQREMPFVVRLIRKTAKRMVGKTGLIAADVEDLQQDLWLDMLQRLSGYRHDRGHIRAFLTHVVKNKAASILAARSAAKRGGGLRWVSLNEPFEDEDGEEVERLDAISVDDFLRLTRGTIRSEATRLELAIDVRKTVGQLPPPQRAICLLLIDENQCAVANVVGIPRSTLRDLIKRLRRIAKDAGLDDYFK